jgi:hypothetical protein
VPFRIYAAGGGLLLEGARILCDSERPLAGIPDTMRRACDVMRLSA